jgi:predicted transcriptional regulator
MLKGFVTFYINYFPDLEQNSEQLLVLMKSQNKELIERLREADYEVAFIITTKESTRVEKIDLDKPFPRFRPPAIFQEPKKDEGTNG